LNKPTDIECRHCDRHCGNMGHWACGHRSKPKMVEMYEIKEDTEGLLHLMKETLMGPEVGDPTRPQGSQTT
jgi:hypothetical protein